MRKVAEAEAEQVERQASLMDDASESIDSNDEVVVDIPTDCYGTLISRQLANCRG